MSGRYIQGYAVQSELVIELISNIQYRTRAKTTLYLFVIAHNLHNKKTLVINIVAIIAASSSIILAL